MPRRVPAALGNFGPKSGPANNPGGGQIPGYTPPPIATPNPIGGQIPGYTPPPGWGDLPTDGGGERPMAPPTTFYAPGSSPMPMPPTGPAASPGIPQPMPPTTSPSGGLGGGVWAGGQVAGPGIPQPMPPTTGYPGVGPIKDPGDPTPPGTGGASGGNVTGPRPSRFPMPQPKMPGRTDVNFYRPPQTKFR